LFCDEEEKDFTDFGNELEASCFTASPAGRVRCLENEAMGKPVSGE